MDTLKYVNNIMEDYYNPRKGLSGVYSTYKGQDKYTLKQIKEMVQRQEAYQLNKGKTKIHFFPIVGHGPHSYQADLMFLDDDDGYKVILCIINVITRVAYAYPQKTKTEEETLENFQKFYKEVPDVEHLQTDRGSEFINKSVKKLFKNIDYYQVDTDYAQGKVERFNQTLRRLITLYQDGHKTTKWVNVLPDLLYNYNHRYHRSIGCAPVDANEQDMYMQEMGKYDLAEAQLSSYKKGDRVRVLLNKKKFQKGRSQWSTKVYEIEKIDGHRLIVNGEPYQYYQLQKVGNVHKKLFDDNEEVDKEAIVKEKKVVRDLRKEGVSDKNIVENKRERRIKFDGSLVGRRYDMGGGEIGTIKKYEADNGEYKWFVKFDKKAKLDKDWVNEEEIKKYLVR